MDWSFQDFTNADFTDRDAAEFNGQTIIGSCFYRENLDPNPAVVEFNVFPPNMTGVTFKRCNLTNVRIPPGNIVEGDCQTERIKPQADGEDWHVDVSGQPVSPKDILLFESLGIPTDPAQIVNVNGNNHVTGEVRRQMAVQNGA